MNELTKLRESKETTWVENNKEEANAQAQKQQQGRQYY